MLSWSLPDAFVKRLVPDPNRGTVAEFVDEVTVLADEKIVKEIHSGLESMTTLISWNRFMGPARCHCVAVVNC